MLSEAPWGLKVSEGYSIFNLDLSIVPVRDEWCLGSKTLETFSGGAPKLQAEFFSTSGITNVIY